MLITTCTHCLARFRVTPQQLNAKQGMVRCGRCRQVFSGFEALERFPDDDTGTRLLAARDAEERAAGRESLQSAEALPDEEPAAPEVPPPVAPVEPVEEEPEPPRALPRPPPPRPAASLTLEPPAPRTPASRAWSYGVVLLGLVLAVELLYAFRGPLAQRYPPLRPALEAACGQLRCTVPWPREDALLKLEESELLEVPGKPSEIALGARIRNLATFAQEYPHVEVTLTDLTGQAATRRVLRPADYLGRLPAPNEVLAGGAELTIQLRIETPRIKATGYELLLFYP